MNIDLENMDKNLAQKPYILEETKNSPCRLACPLGTNAKGYVAAIRSGHFAKALAIVRERNPFPGICGRLCPAPCEKACVRVEMGDEPVAIKQLKQFILDFELVQGVKHTPDRLTENGHKVAIIGSGACGLTAGYFLSLRGFSVTIFEKEDHLGGELAKVSEEVLPKQVLQYELDIILRSGVEIKINENLELNRVEALKKSYDAVLIATGYKKNSFSGGFNQLHASDLLETIFIDPNTFETSIPDIFAAGSIVSGPKTIIDSIAFGYKAALKIEERLLDVQRQKEDFEDLYFLDRVLPHYSLQSVDVQKRKTAKALSLFDNEANSFTEQGAIYEASRCLMCGFCFECEECIDGCDKKQFFLKTEDSLIKIKAQRSAISEFNANKKEKIENFIVDIACHVDDAKCIGCGICEDVCPYQAAKVMVSLDGKSFSKIDPDACKGCGICHGQCPSGAIEQGFFTEESLETGVLDFLQSTQDSSVKEKIVVFSCGFIAKREIPREQRHLFKESGHFLNMIRVMCQARISVGLMLKCFEYGASRVVILNCGKDSCRYKTGDTYAAQNIERTKKLLLYLGFPENCLISLPGHRFDSFETAMQHVEGKLKSLPFTKISLEHCSSVKESLGNNFNRGAFHSWMRLMKNKAVQPNIKGLLAKDLKISQVGDHIYFPGCLPYFDIFYGNSLEVKLIEHTNSAIRILNFLGISPVILDGLVCCGSELLASGDSTGFRCLALKNIDVLKKLHSKTLIVSCPECLETITKNYRNLCGKDFPNFQIKDFWEFLEESAWENKTVSRALISLRNLLEKSEIRSSISFCKYGRTNRDDQVSCLVKMENKGLDQAIFRCPKSLVQFLNATRQESWKTTQTETFDAVNLLANTIFKRNYDEHTD